MSQEIFGYLTERGATELIQAHIPCGERRRERWEALGEADRAALLRAALVSVEGFKYAGRRLDERQELAFPRTGNPEIPFNVPLAQAFEACSLAVCGAEAASRAALRAQGVESFSAGSLREGYKNGGRSGPVSREAWILLSGFFAGVSGLD